MKNTEIPKLLPTDAETEQWFADNIDGDSASSAIYKFRLWLKDEFERKLQPKVHNLAGFIYTSEVEKVR